MFSYEPAAETPMFAIGGILLIGLLFVGFLIVGAILAAKTETRTAGLWIMGMTFAVAVALPLAWLFVGYAGDAPATTYVRGGDGRIIATSGHVNDAAPKFALLLIGLMLVAGEIILLVNEKTRKAGLIVLGLLVVCLLGYLVIGTASLDVQRGSPMPVSQGPPEAMRANATTIDEHFQIPLDEALATTPPATKAPEGESNPTPPAVESAAQPVAAPPPVEPRATDAPIPTPPATAPAAPAAAKTEAIPTQPAAAGATSVSSVAPPGAIGNVQVVSGDRSALPEWAKQGGGIGADGAYFTVVKCGPHLNFDACWNDALNRVDQAVRDHRVRHALGDGYRPPSRPLPKVLREQLMAEHFLERGDSSVGETMTLYTRVAFTREATASLRAWQADMLANNRTIFATVLGALVVGLVAIAYGYFRIDTATLGYYTWRLRFVALFLLIGITISGIAAGAMFFDEEWRLGGINF